MKRRKCYIGAVIWIVLFICGLCSIQVQAGEAAEETTGEETLENLEEEALAEFDFSEINGALEDLFPDRRISFQDTLMGVLSGDFEFSLELLSDLIGEQIGYAFRISRESLVHILLLVLVAAVFTNFSTVFQSRQLSEISFYALYLLLIALCISVFGNVIEWVSAGISQLTTFMGVFCPLYFLAVAVAKGSITSIAFYNLVLGIIFVVELIISRFLLPVIHMYMMIRIMNYISSEDYLSKFSELIEMAVSWILKTLLACVIGMNVMQGLISPAVDTVKRSVLTRGAEAIPGIGDAIGGMTEVVLGTAVLVKNGIGVTGAIICIALCVVPLIQIGLVALLYKLAAAIIQPISDKRIVGCVETVGEGCRLLVRVMFTTSMLFLLTIAVVAATTGNH